MYADVIVTADHVETLAEESPAPQTDEALDPRATANAIAIRDGRILAIGTAPDLEPMRGPGTVVHAFPGATILPGLTDVHAHPVWGSIEIGSGVDLSGASTLDQVFSRLADAAQGRPADGWITGFDLDVNVFDGDPTGTVLAGPFPGRPVSLMTRDAHALVVSPRAVELIGLTGRETFTDASSVEVGPDGRPTGYVVELQAMDLVFAHYPEVPVDTAAGYVRHQLDTLARGGLTGLHALDFTDPSESVYRHIEEHGELPLRIRCSPLVPADSAPEVWQDIADQQGRRGRRWHVEGAKFMLDGTADNGTAWFDRPDIHGENREPLWRDLDAYRAAMRFFTERGIPTATHAIGDQAVRYALDVIEEVGPAAPPTASNTSSPSPTTSSDGSPNSTSWQASSPCTAPGTPGPMPRTTGRGGSAPTASPTAGAPATCWTTVPSWHSARTGPSAPAIRASASPTASCDARSRNRTPHPSSPARRSPPGRPTPA